MKLRSIALFFFIITCSFLLVNNGQAAAAVKQGVGTDLTGATPGVWSGGSGVNGSPATTDIASWSNSSLGAGLTLGTSAAWGGISVSDALTDIDISGAGTLTLGSSGIDLSASAVNLTIFNALVLGANQTWAVNAGVGLANYGGVSGAFALTKTGAGTLSLNGANVYTGTTTVSAGTLSIGSVSLATASALSIAGGGVVQSAGTLSLIADGSDNPSIDVSGAGTLVLTGTTNSAVFPDISFGDNNTPNSTANWGCRIATPVSLGSLQRYVWGRTDHNGVDKYGLTGADCQFGGSLSGAGGLTFIAQDAFTTGTGPMETPFCLNAANSFSGPVMIQRGSVYLGAANAFPPGNRLAFNVASGSNGKLFLYGHNTTVSDLTSAGAGGVVIANGNRNPSSIGPATLTVVENTSGTFSGSLVDTNVEYAGSAVGASTILNLMVTGPGTLTLAGANTYSGTTTVGNGSLLVDGSLGTGGTVTVQSGGTLGGSGAINSPVTIQNGGSLMAGDGAGSGALTLNSLTLGANTGNSVSINYAANPGGMAGGLKVANVNGLTNNAAATINVTGALPVVVPAVYTLIQYSGAIKGGGTFAVGSLPNQAVAYITNNLSTSAIQLVVTSVTVSSVTWVGSPLNHWDQLGSNVWTQTGAGTPTSYADGDQTIFDDTASNFLVNVAAVVSPNSVVVSNSVNNYVFVGNGNISGFGLTKQGNASLTLGTTNSYTGNTTISSGTVVLGSGAAIPSGAGKGDVMVNGTLDLNGYSPTVNDLAGSGVVDNLSAGGSPVLNVNSTDGSTFSGSIQNSSGALELNQTGGGTLILSGSNTYSGGTIINSGILQVGAGGTSGALGTAAVVDNAVLAFNRTDSFVFPNDILGSGSVQQNGSDSVALTGNASYAGPTIVNAGTLVFSNGVSFDVSSGATLTVATNAAAQTAGELDLLVNAAGTAIDASGTGILQLTSTLNAIGKIPDIFFGVNHSATAYYGCRLALHLDLGSSPRTVYGLSGRNDVARYGLTGADCQFAGAISGSGQLTLAGQNSWAGVNTMEVPFVFNASNAFTGPLEIQRGSIYLGNANALTMGNMVIFDPAASMNSRLFLYGFNASVSDLQSAGYGSAVIADGNNVTTTNVGAATLTVTQNNPYTFSGVLCDWFTEYVAPATGGMTPILSLVKNGPAALTLTGPNTYSGTTTINSGKLYINNSSTGGGAITVNSGATLGGSGVINSASVKVMNGGAIEAGDGTTNGTLQLNALTLGNTAGDASTLNLATSAILNVTGPDGLSIPSGAGSVTINVGGSITALGTFPIITYQGVITGTGYAAFQLGALPPGVLGHLSNDAANTSIDLVVTRVTIPRWTGALSAEWSTNTLPLPKNWVLDDDGITPIDYLNGESVRFDDTAANTTVNLNVADVSPISVTFSNSIKSYAVVGSNKITGATGLTKQGTGAVTLATTNNYSGNTTVSAGTLTLGATAAIPSGAGAGNVTVNGTLDVAGFNSSVNNLSGSGKVDNISAGGSPVVTVIATTNSTFAGAIQNRSGSLGLMLAGGGSLTLAGTNTYNGSTLVSNGTLVVNGSIGAGGLTIQGGSALGGIGAVGGACSLADGSALNLTANTPLTVGPLALNGSVTVNVSGNVSPANAATYVLMNHGVKSGTGSFALAPVAGLFSSSFSASLSDTNNQLRLIVQPARVTGTIADVRHVIIFMQENRSFDHYFGSLHGVHGFSDRNDLTFQNGNNVFYQPSGSSYVLPFHTSISCITDLAHDWASTQMAINKGKANQWVSAKGAETMSYYNRSDLPYHYALADAYTICDEYHCSTLTSTDPNRLYLWTGMIDPNGLGGGPVIDNTEPANGWGPAWVTYPELLQQAGIGWKVYQQADNYDDNALAWFATYKQSHPGDPLYDRGIATVPSLVTALQNDVASNSLPSVSWIIAPAAQSEHPYYSPASGAALTKQLLDAVAANPAVYNSTVFLLMYDENDGFFDHEVPILPPAGTPDEFVGGLPIGLGVRVPMILVSPWSRGGHVCSQVFDATSILRFLEDWTGVKNPNISAWRRQVCGDLTSAFDFAHPNTNYPSLTGVSPISCDGGTTPSMPSPQSLPVQESGTLVPRPLPYQPNAVPLAAASGYFTFAMTNSGTASVHFTIYPNAYRADGPWPFDVGTGNAADATFNVATNGGNYDFTCYGPDNFQRHFAGNVYTNSGQIEVLPYLNPASGNFKLALKNATASAVTFSVTNGYVTNGLSTYTVSANSTNAVEFAAPNNYGYYDLTVTVSTDNTFLRRFAGRVETNGLASSLSSSKNASGFRDNVTFTATMMGYATPGGTVQFLTNGIALGNPAVLSNGLASINTAALPRGTNTITAVYSGDALNQPFTTDLTQIVTNHPPVAGTANDSRRANLWLPIKISELLTNATDVDGDVLSLAAVDPLSAQGAAVTTNGDYIDYNNATNNVADSFGYTISDGYGGRASGTVNINVVFGQGGLTIAILSPTDSHATITFSGTPGYSYVVQRATNLVVPMDWANVSTNKPMSNGMFQVQDQFNDLTEIPPMAYYRLLIQQP